MQQAGIWQEEEMKLKLDDGLLLGRPGKRLGLSCRVMGLWLTFCECSTGNFESQSPRVCGHRFIHTYFHNVNGRFLPVFVVCSRK